MYCAHDPGDLIVSGLDVIMAPLETVVAKWEGKRGTLQIVAVVFVVLLLVCLMWLG